MKNKKHWAFIVGLILAITSSSGHAGECGYEKCWGAGAFGQTGRISYSFGKWSEKAAFRAANKSCRWQCNEIRTFYNECAAVARGSDRKWVIYQAQTRQEAQERAKRACNSTSSGCRIIVWACSR